MIVPNSINNQFAVGNIIRNYYEGLAKIVAIQMIQPEYSVITTHWVYTNRIIHAQVATVHITPASIPANVPRLPCSRIKPLAHLALLDFQHLRSADSCHNWPINTLTFEAPVELEQPYKSLKRERDAEVGEGEESLTRKFKKQK
jgi:hypothetical protein